MSVGAGFYPARRFANAPLVPVRRGRCPHRPAAPAGAESPRLPLRGRCHGEAVTEGLSHSGGAEPRPYNRLPHLRLAFALSFRASDRCHLAWESVTPVPCLSLWERWPSAARTKRATKEGPPPGGPSQRVDKPILSFRGAPQGYLLRGAKRRGNPQSFSCKFAEKRKNCVI